MASRRTGFPIPLAATDLSEADAHRFWRKVNVAAGEGACWPWTGGTDKDGYGKFQIGPHRGQRHLRAHRVALVLATGQSSLSALHRCDNPPCCNPRHLFEGTHADNRADCHRKGRNAYGDRNGRRTHPESIQRGEQHWNSQLTTVIVAAIKAEVCRGKYGELARLARKYSVSVSAVQQVVAGRTWRHVEPERLTA